MGILILTLTVITLFTVVIVGVTIKEITSYRYKKRRDEFLNLKRNDKIKFVVLGEIKEGLVLGSYRYDDGKLIYRVVSKGIIHHFGWINFVKKVK